MYTWLPISNRSSALAGNSILQKCSSISALSSNALVILLEKRILSKWFIQEWWSRIGQDEKWGKRPGFCWIPASVSTHKESRTQMALRSWTTWGRDKKFRILYQYRPLLIPFISPSFPGGREKPLRHTYIQPRAILRSLHELLAADLNSIWVMNSLWSTWDLSEKTITINSIYFCNLYNNSVQFTHSVVSDFLQPNGMQYTRPPCPSPTPGVYSNSCLLSRWCHKAI